MKNAGRNNVQLQYRGMPRGVVCPIARNEDAFVIHNAVVQSDSLLSIYIYIYIYYLSSAFALCFHMTLRNLCLARRRRRHDVNARAACG